MKIVWHTVWACRLIIQVLHVIQSKVLPLICTKCQYWPNTILSAGSRNPLCLVRQQVSISPDIQLHLNSPWLIGAPVLFKCSLVMLLSHFCSQISSQSSKNQHCSWLSCHLSIFIHPCLYTSLQNPNTVLSKLNESTSRDEKQSLYSQ